MPFAPGGHGGQTFKGGGVTLLFLFIFLVALCVCAGEAWGVGS
jgi:hypothetical protein